MIIPSVRRERSQQCLFFQVNHFLLSKSYERNSGELTYGQDETSLSWGEMTLTLGKRLGAKRSVSVNPRSGSLDPPMIGLLEARRGGPHGHCLGQAT